MTEFSFQTICILAISQHATDCLAKSIEWSDGTENNLGEIGNFTGRKEAIRKFTTVKLCSVPQRREQETSVLETKMCNSRQTFVHSEHPVLNTANSNLETYVLSSNTHKS